MDEWYIPRLLDTVIQDDMRLFGAVIVSGVKWCGKTTTCKRFAKTIISLQDKSQYERYAGTAQMDPQLLFRGEKPLLIDEWQRIPELWDAARYYVDCNSHTKGQLIFTGSVTMDAAYERIHHSGAGRFKHVRMRTMSLFESGHSTGDVSLGSLFDGNTSVTGLSEMNLEAVVDELVRGGWPETVGLGRKESYRVLKAYCDTIVNAEVRSVDGKQRDANRMRAMMRSLSRNSAMAAKASTIRADMAESENTSVSINTVYDYLRVLKDLCVTDDLQAWTPRLRSKTAVRTSDTRHLTDPAIATYFLNAGKDDLLYDTETLDLLFESMVIRDLRVYAQTIDGEVFHYRDEDGLEVDAIIHLWDGRWGAVEVKLGMSWVENGAESLKRLRNKVDLDSMNPPSFLMVVIPSGSAYTRPDGVHVVPLSCLRN